MEKKEKLSLNALLKESIKQIIEDNQEHSVEDIREALKHIYGLRYDMDYRKEHFGVAIYALKREGVLISVGRGRYMAGNTTRESDSEDVDVSLAKNEISRAGEMNNVDYAITVDDMEPIIISRDLMVETRKSLISVIESHYQMCLEVLSVINQFNYLEASENDLNHVGAMLKYKKGLESQLKELKKDL